MILDINTLGSSQTEKKFPYLIQLFLLKTQTPWINMYTIMTQNAFDGCLKVDLIR